MVASPLEDLLIKEIGANIREVHRLRKRKEKLQQRLKHLRKPKQNRDDLKGS